MIQNSKSRTVFQDVAEDAMNQICSGLGRKIENVFMGRRLVRYEMNVEVRGSSDRPAGRVVPVYKDHVGRLTLEPRGDAVGALMRGGYCGQLCHVGFFEVNRAAPH